MDGLDALVWALAAVVGMLAYLALCGRGARIPGPSWFEIPHDAGRAARRKRRR